MIRDALKYILQWPEPKLSRPVVVFLSDDWGSVRVSDLGVQDLLRKWTPGAALSRFDQYDHFERPQDLEGLFEVCSQHLDSEGKAFQFTPLCLVANPDFDAIRNSDFRSYHNESSATTAQRLGYSTWSKIQMQGIQSGVWSPALHGREHVHVGRLMQLLEQGHPITRAGFDAGYFFIPAHLLPDPLRPLDAAFDLAVGESVESLERIFAEAVTSFEQIFGQKPALFTAPSMLHPPKVHDWADRHGISWVDKPLVGKLPDVYGKASWSYHHTGKKLKGQTRALVRNAVFEPNLDTHAADLCLAQLDQIFRQKRVAIISNHRAAFVGGIDEKNRTHGLKSLHELLTGIKKRWPDVVFSDAAHLSTNLSEYGNA